MDIPDISDNRTLTSFVEVDCLCRISDAIICASLVCYLLKLVSSPTSIFTYIAMK